MGNRRNSINPNTGAPEFGGTGSEPVVYDGPVDPGIDVTASQLPGLVQLPQNVPNGGYYNYGTPGNGQAQYGTPSAVGMINQVGAQWRATSAAPFGVGNMSFEDGRKFPIGPNGKPDHIDHMTGEQIDVRPVRSDGVQDHVSYTDPNYDRAATQNLIDMFHATGGVRNVYFNDPAIHGVTPLAGHDNHFHVEVDPSWTGP